MNNHYAEDVSIIMPTLGRTHFVLLNVKALDKGGFGGTLIIADSNPKSEFNKANEAIQALNPKFKIKHLHVEGQDAFEATSVAVSKVETPYIALSPDDDFYVPMNLMKCSQFLDKNRDYSAVSGRAILVSIEGNTILSGGEYCIRGMEQESVSERVLDLFSNYSEVLFSVVRLDVFQLCVGPLAPSLNDRLIGTEIMWNPIYVICGKVRVLNDLIMVRTHHVERPNYSNQLEFMLKPIWAEASSGFLEYVSEILAKQENIDISKARETLDLSYAYYLSRCLEELSHNHAYYCPPKASPSFISKIMSLLIVLIKSSPELTKLIKNIRSRVQKRKGNPILNIEECLIEGTFFNESFIPIYDVLTSKDV